MLAEIHASPWLLAPLAAALLGLGGWEVRRLARPDVPFSRRLIRGTAFAALAGGTVAMGAGLCVVDRAREPLAYLGWWTAAVCCLLLLLPLALADLLNSLRLIDRGLDRERAPHRNRPGPA